MARVAKFWSHKCKAIYRCTPENARKNTTLRASPSYSGILHICVCKIGIGKVCRRSTNPGSIKIGADEFCILKV